MWSQVFPSFINRGGEKVKQECLRAQGSGNLPAQNVSLLMRLLSRKASRQGAVYTKADAKKDGLGCEEQGLNEVNEQGTQRQGLMALVAFQVRAHGAVTRSPGNEGLQGQRRTAEGPLQTAEGAESNGPSG